MADPDSTRPPSAAAARRPVSVTHSRQPSVASRGSRSSLRRQELQPSSASPTHTPPQDILPAPTPPAAEPQLQDLPPPRQEQQRQPPPPSQAPFTPLFTLVSSTSQPGKKPTLHHPTVHYIFADDDPEILTEALARHHRTAEDPDDDDDDGDQQLLSQDNDPTSRRPRDRAILLDLVPVNDGDDNNGDDDDGREGGGVAGDRSSTGALEVAWASSLTPDWAVVGARITSQSDSDDGSPAASVTAPAPGAGPAAATGSGVAAPGQGHDKGKSRAKPKDRGGGSKGMGQLVLKIEGVEAVGRTPASAGFLPLEGSGEPPSGSAAAGGGARQPRHPTGDEYPALMEEFERRMRILQRVVEAGEERSRRVESDEPADAVDHLAVGEKAVVDPAEGGSPREAVREEPEQ